MRRHWDPERRFPGEPGLAKDGLIIGAMRFEMDIIVVHPFHQVITRFAVLTDERRPGETHVHVAR
jgi:hypothetical protein